jgi:hypothetical protein
MIEPKIVFTRLSRFDAAFYYQERDMIVVDEAFRDSKILPYIIEHEQEHRRSGKTIDFKTEGFRKTPKNILREIRKVKPLSTFAMVSPVISFKIGDERITGVDWFRVVMLGGLAAAVVVLSFVLF